MEIIEQIVNACNGGLWLYVLPALWIYYALWFMFRTRLEQLRIPSALLMIFLSPDALQCW